MKDLINENIIFYNSSARLSGTEIFNHSTVLPIGTLKLSDDETGFLELIQFSSKMSYYNINQLRNGKFYYSEDSNATQTLITLQNGNYDIKEMVAMIQTALNSAGSLVWTLTINLNTLLINYSYTGTPSGDVIFSPFENFDAFDLLGFENIQRTISNPDTSTKICTIGNLESIFVHCNLANTTIISDLSNISNTNILAEIPVFTSFFGNIYMERFSDYSPSIELPSGTDTTLIEFSLRDKHGHLVRFTEDYTMTFRFKKYKKQEINLNKLESLLSLTALNSIK